MLTSQTSVEAIQELAELAEASGRVAFSTPGEGEILTPLTLNHALSMRENIRKSNAASRARPSPVERFLRWSIADRRTRTISPLSDLSVSRWIENCIRDGAISCLWEAMWMDPVNPRLPAHLGRRMADLALNQEIEPDVARLAKSDAEFLTRRALKLAPNNAEIQKLRAEIEKLLSFSPAIP